MRISDWSSDVCSSDLATREADVSNASRSPVSRAASFSTSSSPVIGQRWPISVLIEARPLGSGKGLNGVRDIRFSPRHSSRTLRSEEHTSELQSLMRISYAVFCLKKKKRKRAPKKTNTHQHQLQ